jgi:hypothetical protein
LSENPVDHELKRILNKHRSELPISILNRIDGTLSALPERSNIKKKIGYGMAAALIGFIAITGASLISPSLAQALREIPLVGSVFQSAGHNGLRIASEMGITEQVNETATDHGITMTITEVLYDGVQLSIGYLVESESKIIRPRMRLYVGFKEIQRGSGLRLDQLSDNRYAMISDFDVKEGLPDQFNLKIKVDRMEGFVDGSLKKVKGTWNFKVPVTKLKEGVSSFVLHPRPTKTMDSNSLSAVKVTFTPAQTSVYLEYTEPYDSEHLKPDSTQHLSREFMVYDDRGMLLEPFGMSGSGGSNVEENTFHSSYKVKLAPLHRIPDFLVVKPYVEIHESAGSSSASSTTKPQRKEPIAMAELSAPLPLTMSQGEAGELIIKEVTQKSDSVIVHYEVKGINPYKQSNSLLLQDESGVRYGKDMTLTRTDEASYSYMATFPNVDTNKKLSFVSFEVGVPDFIEELELTIPIR